MRRTRIGSAPRLRSLAAAVALLLAARAAAAQDTLRVDPAPVATFIDARALAADPFGRLYVADAGRDVVVQLLPSGLVLATLGGPGSGEGEFDDPSDVDPTNGLVLLVADAGNGRVQRFSKEHAFLGALAAGRFDAAAGTSSGRPTFGSHEESGDPLPPGRPVAVVSTGANDVFAADADGHVVLRWDRNGALGGALGGYDAGDGALVDPVAVALDGMRSVFVADRARRAVLVFDLFGAYVRSLGDGRLDDPRALVVHGDYLWVVLPDRLVGYTLHGRLEREVVLDAGAPLVDVAFHADGLYVLTATALHRVAR